MAEIKKSFNEIFSRLKKDKKAFLTVALGITGMLLVLLSELPLFSQGSKQSTEKDSAGYSQSLETEVEALLSKIEGAGKVSVLLTYDTGEETVWARDKEESTDGENDKNISEKHIIIDTLQEENGLAVKVIYPRVRGVAVVCSGGSNPQVKSEIKVLLSALFDIGTNKISIAQRAEEE